ncbi:MAG TPA: hypothetical protein DCZ44_03615 [Flavobacteriaceae bacterium]|nr:hypothetical protein [Flavobacteriaceae bacterium]
MKLYVSSIISLFFLGCVVLGCKTDDETPIITDPPAAFNGTLAWVESFGGSGIDQATAVVASDDGAFMVVGSTYSNDGHFTGLKSSTDADYFLMRVRPDGAVDWTKVYGGPDDEIATGITKTSDGGFVLSGYSRSDNCFTGSNGGFHDYYILKVDAQGNEVWCKNFGYPGSDQAQNIIETREGDLMVTGFFDVSASEGQGNEDRNNSGTLHGVGEYWGIKLDAEGQFFWKRYFGGSNNDRSYNLVQANDGGFILIGTSESDDFDITDSRGIYDYWAVKLSASGALEWTRSYGGSEIDIAYDIVLMESGNYLIAGDARSNDFDVSVNLGNADLWLIEIGPQGNLIWEKSLGGSMFDSAKDLLRMNDGLYCVTGSSRSNDGNVTANNGQNDAWTVVVNAQGEIQYEVSIGGSSLDFSEGAAQGVDGSLMIVGNTESNDGDIIQNLGYKDIMIYKID